MDAGRTDAVNRFGLDPRPPSAPPAWIRGPWWLRWLTVYVAMTVLFATWTIALIDEHDRMVVAGIAAPYFATPMAVMGILLIRSRRRERPSEAPAAFAWGAGLSLLSIVLFTFGYAGWPFMLATTPVALSFLVYALTEPPSGRRCRTALASVLVVMLAPIAGVAHLSWLQAVTCWGALGCGVAFLVRQRLESRRNAGAACP